MKFYSWRERNLTSVARESGATPVRRNTTAPTIRIANATPNVRRAVSMLIPASGAAIQKPAIRAREMALGIFIVNRSKIEAKTIAMGNRVRMRVDVMENPANMSAD